MSNEERITAKQAAHRLAWLLLIERMNIEQFEAMDTQEQVNACENVSMDSIDLANAYRYMSEFFAQRLQAVEKYAAKRWLDKPANDDAAH